LNSPRGSGGWGKVRRNSYNESVKERETSECERGYCHRGEKREANSKSNNNQRRPSRYGIIVFSYTVLFVLEIFTDFTDYATVGRPK